jgi:hypothetical protein
MQRLLYEQHIHLRSPQLDDFRSELSRFDARGLEAPRHFLVLNVTALSIV